MNIVHVNLVCVAIKPACAEIVFGQARLSASRKGYRGHVSRLFHKIDDLSSNEFDDYSATSLGKALEQLTSKLEKIKTLDEQLFKLYDDPSELETAVMDAEELYDNAMDKIALARRYIELQTTTKTRSRTPSPSPVNQLMDNGHQSSLASNNTQSSDAPLSTADSSNENATAASQPSVDTNLLSTASTQVSTTTTSLSTAAICSCYFIPTNFEPI